MKFKIKILYLTNKRQCSQYKSAVTLLQLQTVLCSPLKPFRGQT